MRLVYYNPPPTHLVDYNLYTWFVTTYALGLLQSMHLRTADRNGFDFMEPVSMLEGDDLDLCLSL